MTLFQPLTSLLLSSTTLKKRKLPPREGRSRRLGRKCDLQDMEERLAPGSILASPLGLGVSEVLMPSARLGWSATKINPLTGKPTPHKGTRRLDAPHTQQHSSKISQGSHSAGRANSGTIHAEAWQTVQETTAPAFLFPSQLQIHLDVGLDADLNPLFADDFLDTEEPSSAQKPPASTGGEGTPARPENASSPTSSSETSQGGAGASASDTSRFGLPGLSTNAPDFLTGLPSSPGTTGNAFFPSSQSTTGAANPLITIDPTNPVVPDQDAVVQNTADSQFHTNETQSGLTPDNPPGTSPITTSSSSISLGFDDGLHEWTISETGGTESGRGNVTAGSAVMTEGDSFLVTLERDFVVPEDPHNVIFTYTNLQFDTSDPNFINDAFEVALLGDDGNTIVHTFDSNRDAFFNITEDESAALGTGTSIQSGAETEVTLDISNLFPATNGTLVFRLVNNDADTETTVTILDVVVTGGGVNQDEPPQLTVVLENDTAPSGPGTEAYRIDLLTNDPTVTGTVADDQGIDSLEASIDAGNFVDITSTISGGSYSFDPGTLTPGTHSITLRATDTAGQSTEAVLSFTVNTPPIADAGGNRTIEEGTVVNFTAADSSDDEGPLFAYQWSFHDGSTAEGIDATREYREPGVFDVTLTVTDLAGSVHSDTIQVTVEEAVVVPSDVSDLVEIQFFGTRYDRRTRMYLFFGNVTNTSEIPLAGPIQLAWEDLSPAGAVAVAPDGYSEDGVPYFEMTSFTDDGVLDPGETTTDRPFALRSQGIFSFTPVLTAVRQSQPTQAASPAENSLSTKFFVPDSSSNSIYRYAAEGTGTGSWSLDAALTDPRGATANAAGDTLWVIDAATNEVHVHGPEGELLGRWFAEGLSNPQGVATDETDIWIVDADTGELHHFAAAAALRAGNATAASVSALHADNTSPSGLATDGTRLWVSDDVANEVFVYDVTGVFLGRWTLDSDNGDAAGITNNPAGGSDLWVVDRVDDEVYHYAAATGLLSGNIQAVGTFGLDAQNRSPEGIADPPTLTLSTEGDEFSRPVGSKMLLTGQVSDAVTVTNNGRPVDAIDVAGNYFSLVEIQPGTNTLELTARDALGTTATVNVQVTGIQSADGEIDFSQLSDITASFPAEYGRTSFDENADVLYTELAIRNAGRYVIGSPLLIGIKNLSDPSVRVRNADGVTPEGIPYFDVSNLVVDGSVEPSEATETQLISFSNPELIQFDYELIVLGQLNLPPEIVSVPDIEAISGQIYYYDVDATDRNADGLEYSLSLAPAGMQINSASGVIDWQLTAGDVGNHFISVRVEDGRGEFTIQQYMLSVIESPPNRPPLFTSVPVVDAYAELPYRYDANAYDPDGNVVSFVQFASSSISFASSSEITIANHGFEIQQLASGGFTTGDLEGWSISGIAGAFNPRLSTYPGGEAAEGENVAYSNGGTISQILSDKLKASTRYSLQVEVGNRLDLGFPGYSVQLLAGGMLLGTESSTIPEPGTFETITVQYTSAVDDPLAGEKLEIRLYSAGTQTHFDNVRLTAQTVAPEGMLIDQATGVIQWIPSVEQIGEHYVTIEVVDDQGASARQMFVVNVRPVLGNRPPVIISEPVTTLVVKGDSGKGETIDLSTWSVVQIEEEIDPDPNWSLSSENTIAIQSANADPSFLLSDFDVDSAKINGTWRVDTSTDDDFMGFAFGYQDAEHFYLFDWKQNTQTFNGFFAERGMSVKVVNADSPLVWNELWTTAGSGDRVKTIFHNTVPWEDYVDYEFELSFQPGVFTITVKQDQQILDSFTLHDTTYTSGKFGFYNYSQSLVRYSGFTRELLPSGDYIYDVDAIDPDEDAIRYSLVQSPPNMSIDPQSGVIDWSVPFTQQVFFGEDLNTTETEVLEAYPHTDLARTEFRSDFGNVLVEDFEDFRPGEFPHTLTFGTITANLSVDEGLVTIRDANLNGTYASSGSKFLLRESGAGDFRLSFSQPLLGFGFFGTDIGDLGGQLTVNIRYVDGSTLEMVVPHGLAIDSGSALFFGITNTERLFDEVEFSISGNLSDGYGFDDFVVMPAETLRAIPVTVRVEDPHGGFDDQMFSIEVVRGGLAEIRGTVFDDLNGNGERDINSSFEELGIHGATIYLDDNANGRREIGERFTVTDETGKYSFSNLSDGKYVVREELQPGWVQTAPLAGFIEVITDGGEVIQGIDFGNYQIDEGDNHWPTIVSDPPTDAVIQEIYEYEVAAHDLDNDPLVFELIAKPDGMVIDSDLGIVIWQPTIADIGTQDVLLRVSDGQGGFDVQFFTVTVAVPNSAPVITSTPPLQASAGLPYEYLVRAQDANGDNFTFELATAPDSMTIDADRGLMNWTPETAQIGDHDVTVLVRDARGAETRQEYTLSVVEHAANLFPTINSTPATSVQLGSVYRYLIDAEDLDGDPLTFDLAQAPSGMTFDAENRIMSWTPTNSQLAEHTVRLTVSDGRGGIANQDFVVTVLTSLQNLAPQIISNPTSTVTLGQAYVYDAEARDANGDALVWSLATAPIGMSIDTLAGTIRWTPTSEQIGLHDVTVEVADGRDGLATQQFQIAVRTTNIAPNITSVPPTEAAVNEPYVYPVRAVDPEGDPLTFALTSAPSGMTIDAETGLIQWRPGADQLGLHEVAVQVADDQGAAVTQIFGIVVFEIASNAPPTITSLPPFKAAPGLVYAYQVEADDPDGDALTYSLLEQPAGMTIDAASGLVEWIPTNTDVGTHTVTVVAGDPSGAFSTQRFSLLVAVNTAPQITSTPVTSVSADAAYRYDVRVTDAESDPLTFELLDAPTGMTIDQFGRITWSPTTDDIGTYPISLKVSDDRGLAAEQSFNLNVTADQQAPQVALSLDKNPAQLDELVTITVQAVDNVRVEQITLTVDGAPVVLDPADRAVITASAVGVMTIEATAIDAAGNVGTTETQLFVSDPSDVQAPTVVIESPQNEALITGPTDVIGTVNDDNLAFYMLEVAPFVGGEFVEIARGTETLSSGVLGTFDPSVLANDVYRLRLTAQDVNGLKSQIEQLISVTGDLKLGNFNLSFTDLSIPLLGVPISLTRTYDSLNAGTSDDFGYGWRMELRDTNLVTNVAPSGLEDELIYNPFRDGTRVYVTAPGGRREGFTFRLRPAPGLKGSFLGVFEGYFQADAGVTSRLSVESFDLVPTDLGEAYGYLSSLPYNPVSPAFGGKFYLSTADGLTYEINGRTGDLITVADTNANTLTFTDEAILSSTGQRITFERDPQGRITAAVDPMGGRVTYTYDAAGDLVAVTDREQNVTRFVYNEPSRDHFLTDVIDPLGRTGIRGEYDDQGRLIKMIDADGKVIELSHDPDNSLEIIRDQLGNPTTYEYDGRGNVLRETDAEGGVTVRSYDLNNNMLTETVIADPIANPDGETTTFTYDERGNVLTETDPLGRVTRTVYQTFTPKTTFTRVLAAVPFSLPTTVVDPLGNLTRNSYDLNGNLLAITNPDGSVTSFVYDANGSPSSLSVPGSGTQTFQYDGLGNVLRQTDANGHETLFTYDANGNQLTETTSLTSHDGIIKQRVTTNTYDAVGRIDTVTVTEDGVVLSFTDNDYDAVGNLVAVTDGLGRTTRSVYDDRGLLVETIYPDETPNNPDDNPRTRTEYNAVGNVIAEIDEEGHRTVFEYDDVGRLTKTYFAHITAADPLDEDHLDNPFTQTEYDLAGRVVAQIDELGNRTEFEYDAAGNQVLVRDALLNETTSTYDAAGRQIAQTNALGHTTQFVFDTTGRPTETIFADGTSTASTFDDAGRLVARTDQEGHTTQFEYDDAGRLTAVIDARLKRTEYAYDELGNLIIQTDANSHTTTYEYDALGRRTATILPLGQRSETTYDLGGNVASTTDFNNDTVTYDYDARNRLIAKRFPDSTAVEFTYTLTGERETITDARGLTQFSYDTRGRLLSRIDPDDVVISYTYDVAGNRTSVTTPSGTVDYTFDVLNRLETVTDADLDVTRYFYDPISNLVRTELANGAVETREYDDLGQLTFLENLDAGGSVIESFRYELDKTGNRSAVDEAGGRRVEYDYDELYRLIGEDIFDPGATLPSRSIAYTYDDVGNRLTRDDSQESLTTYDYDDNDRLIEEITAGLATVYSYDDNGNTLSKVSPTEQVFYEWDVENRLIAADTDGDGANDVTYQYDADGVRVAQTVGSEETRFLLDKNRPYAQVLEEYTPGGIIKVSYVYGNDLISQDREGEKSFYHYDGLGSTRALSNSLGLATDGYIYDAFGQLISSSGSTQNLYLFAGEQRDANLGLDYLRARYLNPSTGRFVSRDSFEGFQNNPFSLHRYLYANANPINKIDPSGNFSVGSVMAGISVQTVLTTLAVANLLQTTAASLGGASIRVFGLPAREWTGKIFGGDPTLFLGFTANVLTVENETRSGTFLLIGPSVGFSLDIFTSADVTLYTPKIFGSSPALLSGFFTIVDASFVATNLKGTTGKSKSTTNLAVGFAVGSTSNTVGSSVGLSVAGGLSVLVGPHLKDFVE